MGKNGGNLSNDNFGSKFGAMAALAGSAVGLGNMWKFPYMAGENGGSAFIIIYLICILLTGIPVMLAEFIIGRGGGKNVYGSFTALAPHKHWGAFSIVTVITAGAILSFYGTVSGWLLQYIFYSLTDLFKGVDAEGVNVIFENFTSHPYHPILWQVAFMALVAVIIAFGVRKGIEFSSKFLMPLLLVILVVMVIRALTLNSDSVEGLKFLLKPDFSSVTMKTFIMAMAQAFFSMSVGMGVLITYASYMRREVKLFKMSINVAVADTVISILAGFAIIPATFAFGMQPDVGPSLIFLTLPQIFAQMPLGQMWSFLFFVLLAIAALTSAVSLLEVVVAFVAQEWKMTRLSATIICTIVISALGVLSTLSFGPLKDVSLFGMNFFSFFDYLSSNILLPLGGFLISIFIGYIIKRSIVKRELSNDGELKLRGMGFYMVMMRYIVPVAIFLVLLYSIGLL